MVENLGLLFKMENYLCRRRERRRGLRGSIKVKFVWSMLMQVGEST